jgi:hypothetical protein
MSERYGGREATAWVAAVLREYGTTCHLCHHGGADSADHLRVVRDYPQLMYVVSNGRPVHHKRCPTCGRACNIARRAKPLTTPPPVDGVEFFERRPPAG